MMVVTLSGVDVRYCNCAQCGVLLMGDSYKAFYFGLTRDQRRKFEAPVDCRIGGRPYCWDCANRVKED